MEWAYKTALSLDFPRWNIAELLPEISFFFINIHMNHMRYPSAVLEHPLHSLRSDMNRRL